MPFSLMCSYCDNGSNVLSHEQAEAEGWIDIEDDPGGLVLESAWGLPTPFPSMGT